MRRRVALPPLLPLLPPPPPLLSLVPLSLVPLLLLGLAGCDALFDLDHVLPPANADKDASDLDVVMPPDDDARLGDASPCTPDVDGHDEDSDGIIDACDSCPTVGNSGADSDGDGLDDQCDPNLDVAMHDKILFAAMFADAADVSNGFNPTTAQWEAGTDLKGQMALFGNSVLTTKLAYAPTKIEVLTAGVGIGFGAEANVMHSGATCQVMGSDCGQTSVSVACLHAYPGNATGTLAASSASVRIIAMEGPGAITCKIAGDPSDANPATAGTTTLLDNTNLQLTTSSNGSIIVQSIVIYGSAMP